MAKADMELRVFVEGPISTVLLDFANECKKQGVIIESIVFDWKHRQWLEGVEVPTQGSCLRGVKLTTSTQDMREG